MKNSTAIVELSTLSIATGAKSHRCRRTIPQLPAGYHLGRKPSTSLPEGVQKQLAHIAAVWEELGTPDIGDVGWFTGNSDRPTIELPEAN